MNKTIIININSIVFHIEEDAYEVLRSYMIDIKRHFSNSADSSEILLDIENRIAEMFSERIQSGRKEVISLADVNEVITQMGRVSDFENIDEEEEMKSTSSSESTSEHTSHTSSTSFEKKLLRNPDDKIIGGVCSGVGYYFGMEAKWMRLIFILFFVFGGSGVLLYVVLWIVMPIASSRADRMAMRGEEPNLQNFKKNFEEEIENYKGDFTKAKNFISKGVNTAGDGVSSIFKVIGKVIGFFLLFVCGMTIIGMLITWGGFATGILGYQSEMVFPGTEIFPTVEGLIALTAGVAAIIIPFVALFHILVRVLFNTRPMNNYLSLSLWAGWIVSIILILVFVFMGVREFKEKSTIKIEKTLQAQPVYQFLMRDIRVIDASDNDKGEKQFKIEMNGEDLSSFMRDDIKIYFESIDSLEKPLIQYNYSAAGKTYQEASNRASKINYAVKQDGNKIYFGSHFTLSPTEKYRDQSVSVIVYLPIGSKVVLENSLRRMFRNLDYFSCKEDYEHNAKTTEWIMTKSGLQCAPNFKWNSNAGLGDIDEILAKEDEKMAIEDERISKIIEEETKKIEATATILED